MVTQSDVNSTADYVRGLSAVWAAQADHLKSSVGGTAGDLLTGLGAPVTERPNYNAYVYFRRGIWALASFLAAWFLLGTLL